MRKNNVRLMLVLFTLAAFALWANVPIIAHEKEVVKPVPVGDDFQVSVMVLGANLTITFALDDEGEALVLAVQGLPEGSTRTIDEEEINIRFPDGERAEIKLEEPEFEDGVLKRIEVRTKVEDEDEEEEEELELDEVEDEEEKELDEVEREDELEENEHGHKGKFDEDEREDEDDDEDRGEHRHDKD